jgi:hypothetical protein
MPCRTTSTCRCGPTRTIAADPEVEIRLHRAGVEAVRPGDRTLAQPHRCQPNAHHQKRGAVVAFEEGCQVGAGQVRERRASLPITVVSSFESRSWARRHRRTITARPARGYRCRDARRLRLNKQRAQRRGVGLE